MLRYCPLVIQLCYIHGTLLLHHPLGSEVGTGESVAASSATDKSHDTEADKQDETQQVRCVKLRNFGACRMWSYSAQQSVLRKKIVQVEQLQLQMTHKHLPTEDSASSSPPFFFIRAAPDPVPCPSSPEEATGVLAGCFELGTVDCGHPLQSLAQTLTHLYVPMLTIAGAITYLTYVHSRGGRSS